MRVALFAHREHQYAWETKLDEDGKRRTHHYAISPSGEVSELNLGRQVMTEKKWQNFVDGGFKIDALDQHGDFLDNLTDFERETFADIDMWFRINAGVSIRNLPETERMIYIDLYWRVMLLNEDIDFENLREKLDTKSEAA